MGFFEKACSDTAHPMGGALDRECSLPDLLSPAKNTSSLISWLTPVALALLPYLILQLVYTFQIFDIFAGHDEAEHLHVVYALERGERPYLDFIENHPTLFHLFLLGIKQLFHIESASGLYWLAKAVVYLHFAGCLALLFLFMRRIARACDLSIAPAVALILLLSIFAPWAVENLFMWQLRPDWVCYFYAILCVLGHLAFHCGPSKGNVPMLLIAAASGGLSTAILAKSVYIFLPYGIALALYASTAATEFRRKSMRRLVVANGWFLMAGVGVFAAMVGLEVWLTKTSYATYFTANYALNSIKHIPVSTKIDNSPFNHLATLTGLGLGGAIGLALLTGKRLLSSHEHKRVEEFHILVFLLLVILVNGLMPVYSNGLTWVHYYAPSLLALLVLGWLVMDDLFVRLIPALLAASRQWASSMQISDLLAASLKSVTRSAVICLVLSFVFLHYMIMQKQHEEITRSTKENQSEYGVQGNEFVPDALLPKDLTYLTFSPAHKPFQAQAWGYYFMLGQDTGIWRDAAKYGLGPEPAGYWPALYSRSPPDVVLVSDRSDFEDKLAMLKNAQEVDISWLGTVMKADYACMRKNELRVQVARKWIARFDGMGWTQCVSRFD